MTFHPSFEPAGHAIHAVRRMTLNEAKKENWSPKQAPLPLVLVLDDGCVLFPSRDFEGNSPGSFISDGPGLHQTIGTIIEDGHLITEEEKRIFSWANCCIHGRPYVIRLSDGTRICPADPDGRRPGVLFGVLPNGTTMLWHEIPQ